MRAVPIVEARANLSRLVDEIVRTNERLEVTRDGRRAAVILSADDYDAIMERLDILGDPQLVSETLAASKEMREGGYHTLADVTAEMRANGRL